MHTRPERHQRITDGGRRTVFVVDDDVMYTEIAAQFLERTGEISVQTFTEPDRATAAFDGGVDCVVSDYRMPAADGEAVLSAVRDRQPAVPFVFFTVYERSELPSSAVESATAVVEKSTGLEQFRELRQVVEAELGLH
jgi:DNA-binding NtrC family response regulator